MSFSFQILIFALLSTLFLGCAEPRSTGSNNSSGENNSQVDNGDETPQPTKPSPPTPPVKQPPEDGTDGSIENALCYDHNGAGPCYSLQDIDEINQAENMYNYVGPNDSGFPSGFDPVQYRDPKNLFFVPEVGRNKNVSKNFKRKEFVRANATRGHYGYFSPLVVKKVQALRDHFGKPLKINSGYRSPGYNATLNGAARFSRHTYGDAIDFKINGVSFSQIAAACKNLGAAFTQIYTSHIHCDWRTSPLDEKVFGPSPAGRISQLNHFHVQSEIERDSFIVFTKAQEKDVYQFHVETDNEDGDGLVHEWKIYRDKELVTSSQFERPQVQLDPGQYEVYVKVGGNVEIIEQVSVN